MNVSTIGILVVIIVYLIMMLFIGYVYSKKTNNSSEFYLGGRKLGPLVTAMSAEASDMSSWLLMGLPGVAYLSGIADASWTAIGLAIGTYLNWLFVAKRLRLYSASTNSITIPDFFSNRFGNSKVILGVSALFIIIFFVPYTASGFSACGKLFSNLFGVDYLPAMILSAIIIVGYTALGGFLAASTTDLIQSIVMTLALIVIILFSINQVGGLEAVIENTKSLPGYLSLTSMYDVSNDTSNPYGLISILSTLAWGLGYFGMPHVLLRFMATEDENKIKVSRRIATVWVLISMTVAILIGITGYSLSKLNIIETLEGSQSETLIIKIANVLSEHGVVGIIFAGLTMAGILACTMSTADSQLLAASSSVSENIIKDIFNINLSKKQSMIIARAVVLIIAIIAVCLASNPESSVFGIVSFAWAGFGAVFGPLMLFSLFWKRTTKQGAIAGMIVGGLMIFIWKYAIRTLGGIWDIYELLPAFLSASIVIVIVSLLTPIPDKKIIDVFEKVNSLCENSK
ncbi:MAG: sodium/proline symporter PutP [Oscillospiraceae bacterium]